MADNSLLPDRKIEPDRVLDTTAPPTFFMGEERQSNISNSSIIIHGVCVNLDVNGEDRKFSSARPLHEIPLMRALYGAGEVVIRPGWARSMTRIIPWSREGALEHVRNLNRDYVQIRENQTINLVERLYGPPGNFKLFKLMQEMYDAYLALRERLKNELMPNLERLARDEFARREDRFFPSARKTPAVRPWEFDIAFDETVQMRDWEAIVAIADPDKDLFDNAFLPGLDDSKRRVLPSPIDVAPVSGAEDDGLGNLEDSNELIDHLQRDGFDAAVALDVAALVGEYPGGLPADSLKQIEGIGQSDKQLAMLKASLAAFARTKRQPAAV